MKAIAEPIRVEMLDYLVRNEIGSPSKIAREIGQPVRRVSGHMKQLEKYGIVEFAGTQPSPRGSPEHIYRLIERIQVNSDEAYMELDVEAQRSFAWGIYHLTAVDFARAVSSGIFDNRLDWHLVQYPIDVDDEGMGEVRDIFKRGLEEIDEVRARCAKRLAESGEQPIRVSANQLCFELPTR